MRATSGSDAAGDATQAETRPTETAKAPPAETVASLLGAHRVLMGRIASPSPNPHPNSNPNPVHAAPPERRDATASARSSSAVYPPPAAVRPQVSSKSLVRTCSLAYLLAHSLTHSLTHLRAYALCCHRELLRTATGSASAGKCTALETACRIVSAVCIL